MPETPSHIDHESFHSFIFDRRRSVHLVLVRPELGANVGSVARAFANMGLQGSIRVIGAPNIIDERAIATARHASDRLKKIEYYSQLSEAVPERANRRALTLAATARSGSADRPHPFDVRVAVERAVEKLFQRELDSLFYVFGPESDGLTNEEVALCEWVVTIPSSAQYRSLNLAQAALLFCYETNVAMLERTYAESELPRVPAQKRRMIANILSLAEEVGFVLPGDPHKMRPRLEDLLDALPPHIRGVRTFHGLIDQVRRSVRRGEPDVKGRYLKRWTGVSNGKEL